MPAWTVAQVGACKEADDVELLLGIRFRQEEWRIRRGGNRRMFGVWLTIPIAWVVVQMAPTRWWVGPIGLGALGSLVAGGFYGEWWFKREHERVRAQAKAEWRAWDGWCARQYAREFEEEAQAAFKEAVTVDAAQ